MVQAPANWVAFLQKHDLKSSSAANHLPSVRTRQGEEESSEDILNDVFVIRRPSVIKDSINRAQFPLRLIQRPLSFLCSFKRRIMKHKSTGLQ